MKKSVVFNISFLVFVNFLIKPFWVFGIDRTVQNQLGETEYGLYFAILNFTYIFQIFLDFGLQNYNVRHIAFTKKRIDELLPNIILLKVLLFFVYLISCIVIAISLGYTNYKFFFIILINQFLLSFIIYLRSNVSAHQHFITDSLLSVLDKLLMIILCSILIWGNIGVNLSINSFVLSQFLAYFITFLFALYFSFGLIKSNKIYISFSLIKKIIKESLPYATIYFLMTIYYRIDSVMLERMKDSYEVGIYAQSYRIIESINNIGYLMSIVLLPIFSNYLSKNKEIKFILSPAIKFIILVIVCTVGIGYFQSEQIIGILYHTDIQYSSEVFSWLILNFIPIGLLYVIGTLLTANENFRIMIPTLIVAVLLNIILNYFLIPTSGAIGAAQATLITQSFMFVTYVFFCFYTFKISLNIIPIIKMILFVSSSFGLMQWLLFYFNDNSNYFIIVRSILFIIGVGIFAFIFGVINKEMLKIKTEIE